MNRCPISYESCNDKYANAGLRILSPHLVQLNDLAYTAAEQRHEAAMRAARMSVQGVQPKLSAVLNPKQQRFDVVDIHGKFILKPQHHIYPQLPENEDLTMRMAKSCGIEVPIHGMVYAKDGSLTYFIKRFDRYGRNKKIAVEDFAQVAGLTRDTKYNYSIEKLIRLVEEYCTFPVLEKARLFHRILFNYMVGNEDMHMKNYSLIRMDNKIELAPAYDFLSSTLVLKGNIEESALTIKGKKSNLTNNDLLSYLGKERMNLNDRTISNILINLSNAQKEWYRLISISFLNDEHKEKYMELVRQRSRKLDIVQ
ncbi:MAG: HipA domain-containing protein [Bacteroidota bacterium]|nr:HipA domain-containing protein [Bacteroidota bacterium]